MAIPTTQTPAVRRVKTSQNLDSTAWKWMRYSGFLLIPLAWGHLLIQDVIIGVHNIDVAYVSSRFTFIGWRIYDILLLSFAFAHGMNGLRQVLGDLFPAPPIRRWTGWILLAGWLVISIIGAIAVIAFQSSH
jgi:succinate dehydrogenase / fumarate reductase membrane anchor subunit